MSQERLYTHSLLADVCRAGIPLTEFWDMTPQETMITFEASAWRDRREQGLTLSNAWHSAAFARTKRLPSLKGLLKRLEPRKPESLEERRAEFAEMKARLDQAKSGNQNG